MDDLITMDLDQRIKRLEKLRGMVRAIYVFGSSVKNYVFRGDIDIAIYLGYKPDPYELGRIVSKIIDLMDLKEGEIDIHCLDIELSEIVIEAFNGTPIHVKDPVELLSSLLRI